MATKEYALKRERDARLKVDGDLLRVSKRCEELIAGGVAGNAKILELTGLIEAKDQRIEELKSDIANRRNEILGQDRQLRNMREEMVAMRKAVRKFVALLAGASVVDRSDNG